MYFLTRLYYVKSLKESILKEPDIITVSKKGITQNISEVT